MRFYNAIAFIVIFLSNFSTVNAATFTVININDSGIGSLRQAILDVNSSGSGEHNIIVSLSGTGGSTIILQSELPPITNQVHLDGRDQNSSELLTIDGSDIVDPGYGLQINGASAADSIIEYCVIQNFIRSSFGDLFGLFITNAAQNCSVLHCVIDGIRNGGLINLQAGIYMSSDVLYSADISCNYINNISSTLSFFAALRSYGIFIDGDIGHGSNGANCVGNVIENISSAGGAVKSGITAVNVYGDCNDNSLIGVESFNGGAAIDGLYFENVYGDISHNVVSDLSNNFSFALPPDVFGIRINDKVYGDVINNFVTTLKSTAGSVYGVSIKTAIGSILHNTFSDFSSVSISGLSFDVDVFGIRVSGSADEDIAHNCIEKLSSERGSVFGISVAGVDGSVSCNSLSDFTANNLNVTGIAYNADEPLVVAITNNNMQNLSTGTLAIVSGEVRGISIPNATASGVVSGNTISELHAGQSEVLYNRANGIFISDATQLHLTCNTISDISGRGEDTAINSGILIFNGRDVLFRNNIIKNVTAQQLGSSAHGIICGVGPGLAMNCLFEKNVIHAITAGSLEAYGITVDNSLSLNNQILSNSISNIDTAAIFYRDGAFTDGNVQLSLIECSGKSVTISGIISPEKSFVDTDFLIQFFVSPLLSPSQTKFFFGEQTVTVGESPMPFTVTFEPTLKIFDSQFVTATVTALPGGSIGNLNTSVVSNVLAGCSTSMSGLCNIVSTCPSDGLPSVDCPVLMCGSLCKS